MTKQQLIKELIELARDCRYVASVSRSEGEVGTWIGMAERIEGLVKEANA